MGVSHPHKHGTKRPRGARPTPRHRLAAATPHKARADVPDSFGIVPPQLSMWLNDQDGDCVTAEEAAAKAAYSLYPGVGTTELFIPDSSVKSWAQAHGVLNGADLNQVLQWMTTDGLLGSDGKSYTDGPAESVDWTTDATLRSAIFTGPVKIGVAADQLESAVNSTNGANGWLGAGWQEDRNEDHCVSLFGFGTVQECYTLLGVPMPALPSGTAATDPAYLLYTWSCIGVVTRASMIAITGEAWLRTPTTPQQAPTPTPTPPGPTPTPPPGPTPTPPPGPTPTPAGFTGTVTATVVDGVITGGTAK